MNYNMNSPTSLERLAKKREAKEQITKMKADMMSEYREFKKN